MRRIVSIALIGLMALSSEPIFAAAMVSQMNCCPAETKARAVLHCHQTESMHAGRFHAHNISSDTELMFSGRQTGCNGSCCCDKGYTFKSIAVASFGATEPPISEMSTALPRRIQFSAPGFSSHTDRGPPVSA